MNFLLVGLVLGLASMAGCKSLDTAPTSDVQGGFTAYEHETNAALIFTAGSRGDSSRDLSSNFSEDHRLLKEALVQEDARFGIVDGKNLSSTMGAAATASGILNDITAKARDVSYNGTLWIYIGGQGNKDTGVMCEDNRAISYDSVTRAIKVGRQGRPFKRLVLIIAACHSKAWIDQAAQDPDNVIREQLVLVSNDVGSHVATSLKGSYMARAMNEAFFFLLRTERTGATVDRFVEVASSNFQKYVSSAVATNAQGEPISLESGPPVMAFPDSATQKLGVKAIGFKSSEEVFFNAFDAPLPANEFRLGIMSRDNSFSADPCSVIDVIHPRSPLIDARAEVGDCIFAINGQATPTSEAMRAIVLAIKNPEATLTIGKPQLAADGSVSWQKSDVKATFKTANELYNRPYAPSELRTEPMRLGANVVSSSYSVYDAQGRTVTIKAPQVSSLDTAGLGARFGLRQNDWITKVAGYDVESQEELIAALKKLGHGVVTLDVRRSVVRDNRYYIDNVQVTFLNHPSFR